jgi:hypothetical protein
MGDDSAAVNRLAQVGRRSRATQDILRATEKARRASAAAEQILGFTEPARRATEQVLRQQEAHRASMDLLLDIGKSERLAAQERIDREKRSVELTERLLDAQVAMSQSQAALVELERLRTDQARHDRRIQYAVLVLSALALIVGFIALFT